MELVAAYGFSKSTSVSLPRDDMWNLASLKIGEEIQKKVPRTEKTKKVPGSVSLKLFDTLHQQLYGSHEITLSQDKHVQLFLGEYSRWVSYDKQDQWNFSILAPLQLKLAETGETTVSFQYTAERGWLDTGNQIALPSEVLCTVFTYADPKSWFPILSTSRQFHFIGSKVFKEEFLSRFLCTKWTGWTHWTTTLGQQLTHPSMQNMEISLYFSNDGVITGEGVNEQFRDCKWVAEGNYDLVANTVVMKKKFVTGDFVGRVIVYEGKLSLHARSAVVEGTSWLQTLEASSSPYNIVGDKGKFGIISEVKPAFFCYGLIVQ